MRVARPRAADPRRPGYHFTVPAGWINDPLGVTWHEGPEGGRYELFYQFNPQAPVWAPNCRWGQVTSPDLVRWEDASTALEPGPDETGCWSGSVVVEDDGTPVIVYTSILAEAPGQGRDRAGPGRPGLATVGPGTGRSGPRRARAGAGPRTLPRPVRLAGGRANGGWRSAPAARQGGRRCASTPLLTCGGGRTTASSPNRGPPGPTRWRRARSGSAPSCSSSTGPGSCWSPCGTTCRAGWPARSGTTTGGASPHAPGTGWPPTRCMPPRPSSMRPAGGARCPGCRNPARPRATGPAH